MPSKKRMIEKEYRKSHQGHYFDRVSLYPQQGGKCRCGLGKAQYTILLCTGKMIPECTQRKARKSTSK